MTKNKKGHQKLVNVKSKKGHSGIWCEKYFPSPKLSAKSPPMSLIEEQSGHGTSRLTLIL